MLSLAGVLCIGILAGLAVAGTIRLSENGTSFETLAESRAGAEPVQPEAETNLPNNRETVPTLSPVVTPKPVKLSANDVSRLTQEVSRRRNYAIPIRTSKHIPDNLMLWDIRDANAAESEAVRKTAEEIVQKLYGQSFLELTGYTAEQSFVKVYEDRTNDHDRLLRLTAPGDLLILVVRASDMKLLCLDLLVYPEEALLEYRTAAIKAAEQLGYQTKFFYEEDRDRPVVQAEIQLVTETDECIAVSFCGDRITQFAVYPTKEAMQDCEYFLADMQYDSFEKAYPESFVEEEPPKLDFSEMTNPDKIFATLSRTYRTLSGVGDLDTDQMTATFLRDGSGGREDCWKITGGGFEIVISAYSRQLISFKGSIPCKDILDVEYEAMGGEAYEKVTSEIARTLIVNLGSGGAQDKVVKEIDVNAVYDFHYCTMDIVLTDGTWYECYFADGVLKEIWHFADERIFMEGPNTGWVADAVYINSHTGRTFIPGYRDWDGDLHVSPRPAQ